MKSTRYLLTSLFLAVPVMSLAQFTAPTEEIRQTGPIMKYETAPGFTVYSDQRGNTTTLYEQGHGLSFYTQRDRAGNVKQGTIYEPIIPSGLMRVEPDATYDPTHLLPGWSESQRLERMR